MKLLDGPVRTRAFWLAVFGAAGTIVGFFNFDLTAFEATFLLIVDLLVAVGILDATRGTQPIPDPAEKGW